MTRTLRIPTLYALVLLTMLAVPSVLTAAGEGTVTFLVVGDWGREGHRHQRDVAVQMARAAGRMQAEFTVSTGDNFYESGVAGVEDELWRESFEDVYSQPELMHPWFVVLGNHDWRGNWQAQIDYSSLSDRWTLPDIHYTITRSIDDTTSLELFFIDTSLMIREYRDDVRYEAMKGVHPGQTEAAWLDSALSVSTAQWMFVVGHHPIYSSGHHGSSEEVKTLVEPLLNRYHVQAYFNGHDHDVQHQDPHTGTQYFTSGAGSSTREAGVDENTRLAYGRTPAFMAVSVGVDTMRVQVISYRGKTLYRVSVDREGDVVSGGQLTVFKGRWFPPW
jgi:tartrate-resistant acid phosphatase type 5